MGNAAVTARIDSQALVPTPIEPPVYVKGLTPQKKRILFVTSEFADLIKVGGLGDVSAALPRALLAEHDIRVLIPGYRQIVESGRPIRIVGQVDGLAALPACKIGRIDLADGLIVYVLLNPDLYDRDGTPYGDRQGRDWADNHIRFARLGLAAADIAMGRAGIRWNPQLVHANDWPAALAPAYMAWRNVKRPTLLTIHNLAYQGVCDLQCSTELGIPPEACGIDGVEFYGRLSFLKAGIAYASHVTTVSRNYAREITTPSFGCGLDGMLRAKVAVGQLSGIANGIDESWEPTSDPHLVQGFDVCQWEGKQANTAYVEQLLGLESDGPLFAVVSRLVQQKGIDLTLGVAGQIVANGGRLAVIGRGEPELEAAMAELAVRHPGRIGVHIGFNETDARRIYAGSDFLLMPSRFEPCGLSQMYAQRFGSLPIARRTGGLADTIEDGVTGFLFDEATLDSYQVAIHRAFQVYQYPELLNAMRCRAMHAPLYWRQSVKPYAHLYQQLLGVSQVAAERR
ncbi:MULTISPECIES: glycogen synthase GlgA [unclassified Pseudomonas]|uniref:glycogen synthase GlgA n=1 Tax=unclassified Pseudomonas TaxID=196821 RepID=UPI0024470A6C|nr:glycogen synthase GlgA [Pseudomonas sp. GD03944]MDH1265212.1 glycogen synthase GlgA [Pseudomonas sp. GD03944]